MRKVKKFTPIILFGFVALILTCEKIPDYCGKGEWYDPGVQFCFGSKPYPKCGGKEYNPLVEGCINGIEVGAKCLDGSAVARGTPCAGYALTTAAVPENGGGVTRIPNAANYPAGEDVAVIADPGNGYAFVGWAGTGTHATAAPTIKMNAAKTMVAMFKPLDAPGTLTTAAFPENSGAVIRSPNAAIYELGTAVTVTARAKQGYRFDGWAGASASRDTAITLAMDDSKTLVAMFTPNAYTLKVGAIPTDGGAVFVDGTAFSAQTAQNFGTEIEVMAVAADGYRFAEWSGAAQGSGNPARIAVTEGDMEITAKFVPGNAQTARQIYPVTVVIGGPTGAKVRGGSYAAGDTVRISAGTGQTGQTFKNWTSASGVRFTDENRETTTFIMPRGAVTVTAVFEAAGGGGGYDYALSCGDHGCRTVTIGTQTWMAENLNYNASGSWCYYDNGYSMCNTFGRLYDWETAMTVCPSGWHLPSNDEWEVLVDFAGGKSVAGGKLKAASGWNRGGIGTDDFGFSALPGGYRYPDGGFGNAGNVGYWWTATEDSSGLAYYWYMYYDYDLVYERNDGKNDGFSVRCIAD